MRPCRSNPILEAALFAALALTSACSGEPEPEEDPYTTPTLGERPLPSSGRPDDVGSRPVLDAGRVEEYDLSSPEYDADPGCCPVTFAIAEGDAAGASWVQLIGSAPPLADGLLLTLDEGTWSAESCVPSSYVGTYTYVIGREVDGELEEEVTLNPHAPSNDGVDNLWLTSDTCDQNSIDLHAQTSSP